MEARIQRRTLSPVATSVLFCLSILNPVAALPLTGLMLNAHGSHRPVGNLEHDPMNQGILTDESWKWAGEEVVDQMIVFVPSRDGASPTRTQMIATRWSETRHLSVTWEGDAHVCAILLLDENLTHGVKPVVNGDGKCLGVRTPLH